MMAKIVKGSSFGGCVRYVMGKKDAKLLAAEGVLLDSKQSVVDSLRLNRYSIHGSVARSDTFR